jgi:HD-GYP domain-containing protein (c-di-GMP phosphodiesterase class II)
MKEQAMTADKSSHRTSISRAELVSSLSHALDMTEGQPEGHGIRCAWIGLNIGREAKLSDESLANLYYTLLLKDIGCSSNAARICELYLADDLSFKRDVKSVNDSLPQILRFVLSHTGLKAGMSERFRSLLTIVTQGGQITRELIETRCQRGADIARQMRFPEEVASGILDLDEHWDGKGKPMGIEGEKISIFARIALIAQVVDVFNMGDGKDAALREVVERSGTWFDPLLVEAFERAAANPAFWKVLASPDLQDVIVSLAPDEEGETLDEDYLDEIAAAFAQVVDSKSPYTAGHSDRVALFTDMIAEELGLTDERRRFLKRAALLHDLGKLGVSNQILDKPAKLTEEEFASVREHPAKSQMILSRVSAFDELARIAGDHHERLDGKGYPRGISGRDICIETRIITCADIFDALTANRPYRDAMPVSKALGIMRLDVGSAIDAACFAALEKSLERLEKAAA